MGPCGNESLYQAGVYADERYHCNLAPTLTAWAAANSPDVPVCTWGFGELAPPGDSTTSLDYTLTTSQADLVDTLGE